MKAKEITVSFLMVVLTGCATSSLERAGELGSSGARLTNQAASAYVLASENLSRNAVQRCISFVLAQGKSECSTQTADDVKKLQDLIEVRAELYRAISNYYLGFSEVAREKPMSLVDATNNAVDLAKNLAALMDRDFPENSEKSFKETGFRLEALVQMIEERRRLQTLRESSRHMREVLRLLAASYAVEQQVLESIDKSALANSSSAVKALLEKDLLDYASLTQRASGLAGVPISALSKNNNDAWMSTSGKALIGFLAREEAERDLRRRKAANELILSGLHALMKAHDEFENKQNVTAEDVDIFAQRLAIILERKE